MKVVILAGGYGTRISEESHLRPKPMIEIGGMPILWHIMKFYSSYGYNDFIICAGYKQSVIKEWFSDYYINHSDVTFDFTKKEKITVHNTETDPWRVTVVDTGLYGIVRHPMYAVTILLFLMIPLILGSWYALIAFAFYPVIIVVRLKDEEDLLGRELVGYEEYKKKVKYRLIPFIW